MIRDCIVCASKDNAMQQLLLAEPTLSYRRAVELSLSLERVDKDIKELKFKAKGGDSTSASTPIQEVHHVTEQHTCFHCGKTEHLVSKCQS